MDISVKDKGIYNFGGFTLDSGRRTLTRDDQMVKLVPRLFEILLYMVANPGRVIDKDELLAAVWGGRIVEEANLTQAISALRKVLQTEGGDGTFIVTSPGRGYRFVAEVQVDRGMAGVSFAPPPLIADAALRPAFTEPASYPIPVSAFPQRYITVPSVAAAGLALAVIGALAWRIAPGPAAPPALPFAPPPHSVAVLPFTNMSGDSHDDYVSDGLAEELIDSFSRLGALHVAARMSSFSFKGTPATIADIARQLHVGAILEGSVRRDGAVRRITAHLTDAATGYELWSHSYDIDQGNLLKTEGDIAASVTGALKVTLLGGDAAQLTLGGTANAGAFEAYLHGMTLMAAGEKDSYLAALAKFDSALARDPAFVQAQVQRANALSQITMLDGVGTLPGIGDEATAALAAADRAVAMAPDLGVAHAARAKALDVGFARFAEAEAEATRALSLAPGSAAVQMYYGRLEIEFGRITPGVAAIKRAVELDPLTSLTHAKLAAGLYYAHMPDEALAALRDAQALDPAGTTRDQDLRGAIELMKGDWAAAVKICGGEVDWAQNECLAIAYHGLGQQKQAEAQLAKLHKVLGASGDDVMNRAEIEAQWGRKAEALRDVEAATDTPSGGLAATREDPYLDPIRDTPEFQAVLQRLKFPR